MEAKHFTIFSITHKNNNDKKHPVLIQSEHIEYIDEVKAK